MEFRLLTESVICNQEEKYSAIIALRNDNQPVSDKDLIKEVKDYFETVGCLDYEDMSSKDFVVEKKPIFEIEQINKTFLNYILGEKCSTTVTVTIWNCSPTDLFSEKREILKSRIKKVVDIKEDDYDLPTDEEIALYILTHSEITTKDGFTFTDLPCRKDIPYDLRTEKQWQKAGYLVCDKKIVFKLRANNNYKNIYNYYSSSNVTPNEYGDKIKERELSLEMEM